MRFFGNILWFIFGGWYLALSWLLGALVFAITIIGLPLTRSAIEMAKLSAFPFGKDVMHVRDLDGKDNNALTGTIGLVFNILWCITFGWILFVMYLVAGVLSCLTIILIPFGLQSFKLAGISFWPVGRRVVSKEMAEIARKDKAQQEFDKLRDKKGTNISKKDDE